MLQQRAVLGNSQYRFVPQLRAEEQHTGTKLLASLCEKLARTLVGHARAGYHILSLSDTICSAAKYESIARTRTGTIISHLRR
jgi:hypothetical protein